MISVEEARARILAPLRPVGAETVALDQAWRRVLAAPLLARLTQPPAAVSAMDGYAVRAAEASAGATLIVTGEAPAGHPFDGILPPGGAIRLFTGSVLPQGADCVVIQEDVDRADQRITLREAGRLGRHVRIAGQDFAAGDVLLPAGRRLSARDVGLAASANHPWLTVHRKPRVALLATGDEITLPGEPIPSGGIVSSNSFALAALARAAGAEPMMLPLVADNLPDISHAIDQAAGCDLLVTSGGASVGDHDLVQAAFIERGMTLDFWKVAMRPGKPLIHGRLGEIPFLGLPGNPVSALVCATLFLLPALAIIGGEEASPPLIEQAVVSTALPENDSRADHLRARLRHDPEHGLVATAFKDQSSSLLRLLVEADALILRPPHAPACPAGSQVDVIRLAPLGI